MTGRHLSKNILYLLIALTIAISGCSKKEYDKLEISTSTWIGYSPLYYIDKKGWLDSLNIKLLKVVSLGENMNLFLSHRSDAFVGTQYEYKTVKKRMPSLQTVTLFDRSNGGDMILSSVSTADLKQAPVIDAYLESDSVNIILLKDFLKLNDIPQSKINLINKDQGFIEALSAADITKPTLIITYAPFNVTLENKGFKEIASTRDGLNLLVVDALFANQKVIDTHRQQFEALDILIAQAINDLHSDPKSYYETVRTYLSGVSYEEFLQLKQEIVWIHKSQDTELLKRLEQAGIQGLMPVK